MASKANVCKAPAALSHWSEPDERNHFWLHTRSREKVAQALHLFHRKLTLSFLNLSRKFFKRLCTFSSEQRRPRSSSLTRTKTPNSQAADLSMPQIRNTLCYLLLWRTQKALFSSFSPVRLQPKKSDLSLPKPQKLSQWASPHLLSAIEDFLIPTNVESVKNSLWLSKPFARALGFLLQRVHLSAWFLPRQRVAALSSIPSVAKAIGFRACWHGLFLA